MNPFAVLGMPVIAQVDPIDLDRRFRELSKVVHPDRHIAESATARRSSLLSAMDISEAYRMVRNPIRRAEALLKLRGLEGEIGETREPKPDPSFLMDVLDRREALDDARRQGDVALLLQLAGQARADLQECTNQLMTALDRTTDMETLRLAIPLLGQLRYATRYADEAAEFVEEATQMKAT